jgi:fimbrial chaperone protein
MKKQFLLSIAAATSLAGPVQASSLQVSPVTLEIPEPGQSAAIHLRNLGDKPMAAQLRVFRWSQEGGADRLEPAAEVAVSPPAVNLEPGADYAARIVRLDRTPVQGELSYRLMVDELPDADRQRNGAVALVVRYSIPVFFTAAAARAPQLTWGVEQKGARLSLVARNDGGRRLRLSNLAVSDKAGHRVSLGAGLAGYVLGGSSMRFTANTAKGGGLGAGALSVSAMSDLGPIHGAIEQR